MEMLIEVELEVYERFERIRRAFEDAGLVDRSADEDDRRNATLGLVLEVAGRRRSRATPDAWARREKARDVLRLLNDADA